LLGNFIGNDSADWYGRFFRSWTGGGTSTTRLNNWLDPSSIGGATLIGTNVTPEDNFENDDTSANAKPISAGNNQARTVHYPGDLDWISFNLSQPGTVIFDVTGMNNTELASLALLQSNGTTSIQTTINTSNPSTTPIFLSSGNYYAQFTPDTNNGPLTYSLSYTVFGGDTYDYNPQGDNSFSTATSIAIGEAQSHNIFDLGDQDWLTFTLSKEADVVIKTAGSTGDTELVLYDNSVTQIATDDNSGSGLFSLISERLEAGTYFIRVTGKNDSLVSQYQISLTENDDFLLLLIPAIISASQK